jgi:hypothetical protein
MNRKWIKIGSMIVKTEDIIGVTLYDDNRDCGEDWHVVIHTKCSKIVSEGMSYSVVKDYIDTFVKTISSYDITEL